MEGVWELGAIRILTKIRNSPATNTVELAMSSALHTTPPRSGWTSRDGPRSCMDMGAPWVWCGGKCRCGVVGSVVVWVEVSWCGVVGVSWCGVVGSVAVWCGGKCFGVVWWEVSWCGVVGSVVVWSGGKCRGVV